MRNFQSINYSIHYSQTFYLMTQTSTISAKQTVLLVPLTAFPDQE